MKKRQVCWEDIDVGQEIPSLVKHVTTRQLVKWAGASGDYSETHYDKDFAQKKGLPTVLVHGKLTFSFLAQLVTDFIGEEGTIKKIEASFRGMHFPGQDIACRGKVSSKYERDGELYVELEIWSESPEGEKTTPGSALVVLLSRKGLEEKGYYNV